MTDLQSATALETAGLVRAGEISALEACDAAIARIEARDGPINAVVVRDFDRARNAARGLDADRQRKEMAALAGVPITVKESHKVAGLPCSWGVPAFKEIPVDTDSVGVQRLKAAGATILGKTNIPVMLGDWQADSPVYGRTNNPHDPTRSPGGSSGGGAAALAARMVPLEYGSDIGGSIRVPAALSGVFGHKPTYELIPQAGHGPPLPPGAVAPLAVVGPLARTAADLMTALDVLAGPVESAFKVRLPPPRCASLRGARVLLLTSHPVAKTDAAIIGALETLTATLERNGASVARAHPHLPDLAEAHRNYVALLRTVTTRGAPGTTTSIDAHDYMTLLDTQARLTRAWRRVFDDVDVVLSPVAISPAFPHQTDPDWNKRTLLIDGAPAAYGGMLAWPGVATFPGLPATAAPIAMTQSNLPIGVQIMGAPYDDRTTIGFADLLEKEGLAFCPMPAGI